MSQTVAVAMSGGVDSSVAAALLKEQGREVIGITLQLWPKASADLDRHHGCCSLDAVEDARRVAAKLDIPYYVLDVQEEFGRRVIDPFLADYEQGRTPNPCISCNSEVKFDLLLRKAREIGADRLATGHYARIDAPESGGPRGQAGCSRGPLAVSELDPGAARGAVGPGGARAREVFGVTGLGFAAGGPPAGEFAAEGRIRYGAERVPARVRVGPDRTAVVEAEAPLIAVAPGQAAVLYRGDEVLGGGRIMRRAA